MDTYNNILVMMLRITDALTASTGLLIFTYLCGVDVGRQYNLLALLIFLLTLLVFPQTGLYKSWRGSRLYLEYMNILKAWIIMSSLVFFVLFITKTSVLFSRKAFLCWLIAVPSAMILAHAAARHILRTIRKHNHDIKNAIIIGAGKNGYDFAGFIEKKSWTGIHISGYFDDRQKMRKEDRLDTSLNMLGTFKDIKGYLDAHPVDYIYIVLSMRAQKRIEYILALARTGGARVFLVPDIFSYYMYNARIEFIEDKMVVNFNPEESAKRQFDICFSMIVLTLLSPLFLIIALAIKLEDNGPVFYRHMRITATGKQFGCLKFRTMHRDADIKLKELLASDPVARAEWEKTFKLKNDPRITKIGGFLRKASLDELPQFWNVLVGEMSVVGARPIVSRELYDYYKDKAGLYCSIKPGITGLWQVSGRSDIKDYDQRIVLDTEYILNRNLWIDSKIIVRTALLMITGKGAY